MCVDSCPAKNKKETRLKALNMVPQIPIRMPERENYAFFLNLPEYDRRLVRMTSIKANMLLQPLFEYSGACSGCGETPYVKLMTQLFGDRAIVANATGCSSIYGGNLPTTPYTTNKEGRGPAWNNSLFEDNAEFGLGYRLTIDKHAEIARELVQKLSAEIGAELASDMLRRTAAIQDAAGRIEDLRARAMPAYQARLSERLSELLGTAAIEPARLMQEAAILVDRGDVSEELTRLSVHAGQLEGMLKAGGEVGKKIDFLLQEMGREANTILSKTNGIGDLGLAISDLALAVKAEIEKIREQSLNLE